jgi:hypothetical protein
MIDKIYQVTLLVCVLANSPVFLLLLSVVFFILANSYFILAIDKYKPQGATTNPSRILAASKKAEYASLIDAP